MFLNAKNPDPLMTGLRHYKVVPRLRVKVCLRRLNKYRKKEAKEHELEIEKSLRTVKSLPPERKIDYELQSLATRGFLRSIKPYEPQAGVEEKIKYIAKGILGAEGGENLSDPLVKYKVLSKCFAEFNHDVPNSQLHKMNSLYDVIEYYMSPVRTTTSYDNLCNNTSKLPPNLSIQAEPIRFHPETDTLHGGITAFPESSTIVTGLKARKKFRGYDARVEAHKIW